MASKRSFSTANFLIFIGVSLLIAASVLTILIMFPAAKEEVHYQITKNQLTKDIVPVDTDFGLVIKKIGANSKVIANVDPFDSYAYQRALAKGVAQAAGSANPGESGNLFLFSHSSTDFYLATRYNSIFYLLDKLEKGDQVDLYFQGRKFTYVINTKLLVNPEAVNYLEKGGSPEPTLTLMTCWPPGTSIKRLILQGSLLTSK